MPGPSATMRSSNPREGGRAPERGSKVTSMRCAATCTARSSTARPTDSMPVASRALQNWSCGWWWRIYPAPYHRDLILNSSGPATSTPEAWGILRRSIGHHSEPGDNVAMGGRMPLEAVISALVHIWAAPEATVFWRQRAAPTSGGGHFRTASRAGALGGAGGWSGGLASGVGGRRAGTRHGPSRTEPCRPEARTRPRATGRRHFLLRATLGGARGGRNSRTQRAPGRPGCQENVEVR